MNSYNIRCELEGRKAELAAAAQKPESELQAEYNTDECKVEILAFLQEDIDEWQKRYDEAVEEEEAEESRDWRTAGLDPAFGSWAEVNRMFV